MATRAILKMGNPLLRAETNELSKEQAACPETAQLINDMVDTMRANKGIGIAAPQIGVPLRLAIIEIPQHSERYPDVQASSLTIFINPTITLLDATLQGFWEGCLSVPGLRGHVNRPRKVQVDYFDINMQKQTLIAEDFLSTVVQHELDHLFGNLFIDKISEPHKLSFDQEYFQYWHQSPNL